MKALFILILALFFNLNLFAGKPSVDSTKKLSVGINMLGVVNGSFVVYANYQNSKNAGFSVATGYTYKTLQRNVANTTRNVIEGTFIKPSLDFYLVNELRFSFNMYYCYGVHHADAKIPTQITTYQAKYRYKSNFFGIGISETGAFYKKNNISMDLGGSLMLLFVNEGLITRSFSPGAGYTKPINEKTIAIDILLGVRYKL